MGKASYVYLFISLSFFIILIISFVTEVDSKVIIGYSIVSFIFAVLDLITTLLDNIDRSKIWSKDKTGEEMNSLISHANELTKEQIEVLQTNKKKIVMVKNKLVNNMLNDPEKIRLDLVQKNGLDKPSINIMSSVKNEMLSLEQFDKFSNSLEDLKPKDRGIVSSIFIYVLLLIAFIFLIVTPFIPDAFLSSLFGKAYSNVGTILTLTSLAVIFLTSFIRHHYNEKFQQLQLKSYYKMKAIIEKAKSDISNMYDATDHNLQLTTNEMQELFGYMNIAIQKTLEKKTDSG